MGKLTAKNQVTISQKNRKLLWLRPGDSVAFVVKDQKVSIRKAIPIDFEFAKTLEGILSEWSSKHDQEAYDDF